MGLLLCCWLPLVAGELEMGELVIHSSPGQPLRASIPIGLPEGLSLAALRVSAADPDSYRQLDIERPVLLDTMRIALLARGERRARIQLFANESWQGESLHIVLMLGHSGRQQAYAFTVHPIQPRDEAEYIQVGTNETLDSVALRLADRHSRSYLHMMYALYQANPQAFYRNNMNNLRGSVRLRIPSNDELYRFDDAEAFAAIRAHQQRWQDGERTRPQPATTGTRQLDLERGREELQSELEQITAEEARFSAQNATLRAQLAELEGRVSQIGARLFEPEQSPTPQSEPGTSAAAPTTTPAAQAAPPAATLQLPNWLFMLLLALVIGMVVLMQRRLAQHKAA